MVTLFGPHRLILYCLHLTLFSRIYRNKGGTYIYSENLLSILLKLTYFGLFFQFFFSDYKLARGICNGSMYHL